MSTVLERAIAAREEEFEALPLSSITAPPYNLNDPAIRAVFEAGRQT